MLGGWVGRELEIDGRSSDAEGDAQLSTGFAASFDQRFASWFSLGIAGRVASWDSKRTAQLGYGRTYLELVLVPRLRRARGAFAGYVAFPFGLTWPKVSERPQRAVRESWQLETGSNLGAALGIELWDKHWGGYVELCYCVRVVSANVTTTPLSEPAAAVKERLDYVDRQLLFTLGGLYGL